MAAHVGTIVVEDELGVCEFRAPRAEPVEIEFVVVDKVDVHVQALRRVLFALVGSHKGVGALDAVNKVGAAQDHALIDHELEGLVECNVPEVAEEFGPKP